MKPQKLTVVGGKRKQVDFDSRSEEYKNYNKTRWNYDKQFAYVVTDGEQKYSYEYIDVKTFNELDNIFSSYSYITDINADLSKVEPYKINNNGSLHIERDDINSPTTPVMYKVEIVKKLRNSDTGIVINPTHSEYYNKIREYFKGNPSVNDNEDTYEMRIRFFATINKVVNNSKYIFSPYVILSAHRKSHQK